MDFDLNATLMNYQNYHAVTHFRQRIAAAATPPPCPTLPASTSTDISLNKSAPYNDLPNEVILRLGSDVPIEDMGSFAAIDSRTYQLLRDKRLIWSYWKRANKVVNLSSLKRVLGEIEEGITNPQERVEPIKALQGQLHRLPPAQRSAAFKQMFTTAKSIPVDGGQLQKAMIAMLRDFPEWQRLDLFQFVVEMVEAYGPEQENFWLDLQEALPSFTSEPSQFFFTFSKISKSAYLFERA